MLKENWPIILFVEPWLNKSPKFIVISLECIGIINRVNIIWIGMVFY